MDETLYYKLEVAGLERDLAICPVSDNMSIAAFIMFSDVELTVACARDLLARCPGDFDIIITAESKGIPLAYEMSRQCGKKYILARKSKKLYMKRPVGVDVKSITTDRIQTLYLDIDDMKSLEGKKVLVVDDVVSTGESLAALHQMVDKAGGEVVAQAAVLAEGDAGARSDLIFLEKLPVFLK